MKKLIDCVVGDLVWRVRTDRREEQVMVFAIKRKYMQVCSTANRSRPYGRLYDKETGHEKGHETLGGYTERLLTDDQYQHDLRIYTAHTGLYSYGFRVDGTKHIPEDKLLRIYEAVKAIMEEP